MAGLTWMAVIPMSPRQLAEHLGYLPNFIDDGDKRSVKEQINDRYAYGGGWQPTIASQLTLSEDRTKLLYPGDPPTRLIAMSVLRDETILFFEHDWVVILQTDGSWEASRLD